jgi:glycine hydroxymethyltransferase
MLVDLGTDWTGQQAEDALERVGIAVNKNMIPYDPRPPRVTSGIHVGTPAVTTRGMGLPQMEQIGALMGAIISAGLPAAGDDQREAPKDVLILGYPEIRERVRALCSQFPLSWG